MEKNNKMIFGTALAVFMLLFGAAINPKAAYSEIEGGDCSDCSNGGLTVSLNKQTELMASSASDSLNQSFSFNLPGGYAAKGVGMRNRGYGEIAISEIPEGSNIEKAFLYWDILDNAENGNFSSGKINGNAISGTRIGSGADACWGVSYNFAYRADVTGLVTGNGTYSLADFASGTTDGCDPSICRGTAPFMEGASLVIIYRNNNFPNQTIIINNGAATLRGDSYWDRISGFTVPASFSKAAVTFIGADGQKSLEDAVHFNYSKIADNGWNGSDSQSGFNFINGNLWDSDTYDVTALVKSGDTAATVQNSSFGDCIVWVATVFSVSDQPKKEKFVYVALGDSYQSGEGAGNSISDTNSYLNTAYENGKNYPWIINGQPVGSQTNTYVKEVQVEGVNQGSGCHRALENYAKINRDKLKPGAEVILIDQTCSGAKIEPGIDRDPVAGIAGSGQIDPNSQTARAMAQLNLAGLTPVDVDLVTVGMGGNDAKFTEIVQACLLPNILREALQKYPNPPSEIKTLVDTFATCENIDKTFFNSGGAINKLKDKEIWAINKILAAFPDARVMQLNYPNILPKSGKSLAWCGGIRKEDINYASGRLKEVNKKIVEAANAVAANNSRFELVNVENSFGDNPLCPAISENALVNGIDQSNFNAEIGRLLNLDGNGDSQSRTLIDQLVASYTSWKQCWSKHLAYISKPLVLKDCDVNAAWEQFIADGNKIIDYLKKKNNTDILPNIIAPNGSSEAAAVRFDRSQGLFHPNINGTKITACNVLAAYNHTRDSNCLPSQNQVADTVNGNPAGNAPINAEAGSQIRLYFGGFSPNSAILIMILSTPKNIGTATSDSNGIIDATITLPDAEPGVHTIILEGVAANGAGIAKQFRVNYPGNPDGGASYGMYFTGFSPNDGQNGDAEKIDIVYGDRVFVALTPDEDGGVFVELPLFDQQGLVRVAAKSQTTGKSVEKIIQISGDIDSIIANAKKYVAAGLITGTQKFTLPRTLNYLKYQFNRLNNAKTSSLWDARKNYLIPLYTAAINKQINDIIATVKTNSGKTINQETAQSLISSLMAIKIK